MQINQAGNRLVKRYFTNNTEHTDAGMCKRMYNTMPGTCSSIPVSSQSARVHQRGERYVGLPK